MDHVDDMSGSDEADPQANELRDLLGEDHDDLDRFVVDGRGVIHDVTSSRRKVYPQPPPIAPVPVVDVPSVLGRRVICVNERGPIYDLRASSEVFTDDSGSWIRVVSERRWYAWLDEARESRGSSCPRSIAWAATNVWLEQSQER
jgi:hypothetical protein